MKFHSQPNVKKINKLPWDFKICIDYFMKFLQNFVPEGKICKNNSIYLGDSGGWYKNV